MARKQFAMRTRWRLSLLGPLLVLLFSRPIYSGYKHHTLELLLKELEHYVRAEETRQPNNGTTLPRLLSSLPLRMLEFGNQRIHDFNLTHPYQLFDAYGFKANLILPKEPEPEEPQSPRRWVHVPVRPFFEHLGLSYVSVDYNGADGSLPLDVRGTLRDQLREKYDIITNIGFSEHVGEFDTETNFIANQYSIFKNFHELGNAGTLYFHEVPTYFDWHLHGVAGYDVSFFEAMIQRNEYLQGTVVVSDHHGLDKKVVVACYEQVRYKLPRLAAPTASDIPAPPPLCR